MSGVSQKSFTKEVAFFFSSMVLKLTVKFLCSGLKTFSLTCWSPALLPHFIVFASNTASPFWAFLVSRIPHEDGIQDRLSVVLSVVLFPDLSQTKAWIGALRKQFENSLAVCSCFCEESSNTRLFNSMWCGAPEIKWGHDYLTKSIKWNDKIK